MARQKKVETSLIDTVDSGRHYSVIGTPEQTVTALGRAFPDRDAGKFVKFTIADRDRRTIYIDPDKVIAVLEPV